MSLGGQTKIFFFVTGSHVAQAGFNLALELDTATPSPCLSVPLVISDENLWQPYSLSPIWVPFYLSVTGFFLQWSFSVIW